MYRKVIFLLSMFILVAGLAISVPTANVDAQAPPAGTSYIACKANPDWRWVGLYPKGKCRRKVGKFLKDAVKPKPKLKVMLEKLEDEGGSYGIEG